MGDALSEDFAVVATGPSGFAGASQIMCAHLTTLAAAGYRTTYVGTEGPYAFRERLAEAAAGPVPEIIVPNLCSAALGPGAAIPSHDAISNIVVAEAMADLALQYSDHD